MVGSSRIKCYSLRDGSAQFPVTRSPQKTLAGLVFALVVVGVAPD
jgi:hypothetical protein